MKTYHWDTIGLGIHNEGNNETIETQDFGENENKSLCLNVNSRRDHFRAISLTVPMKSLGYCAVP